MIDSGEQNVYDLKKKLVLEPSHIIWTDPTPKGAMVTLMMIIMMMTIMMIIFITKKVSDHSRVYF